MTGQTTHLIFVGTRLATVAVFAFVIGMALLQPAPVRLPPPIAETERALFDEIVREEPQNRTRALEDWAHHRWSQLDAFGAFELDRVSQVASQQRRSPFDLFLILDRGLRAQWPGPDGKPLSVATVPLKPRPMD